MSNVPETARYRWKGKIVTKRLYEQRLAQQKSGFSRRKTEVSSTEKEDVVIIEEIKPIDQEDIEDPKEEPKIMDGRRIVDLNTLGKQMWCVSCKQALSFEYIKNETRLGFGSQLSILCHNCLLINQVSTSKQRESQDKRSIRFETNYRAVLGILHTGVGWSQFTKLCACLNIPCFDHKTFKKYKREIELAAEKVAKNNSENATALERKLTMEEVESIAKLLLL